MSTEAAQILELNVPSANPPAAKTEAPAPGAGVTATPPAATEQVSSKLEVLARREQAALHAERLAAQREKDIETRESRIKEFESIKSTNPKKALEMLGLSYDELTKIQLLDGEIPPEVQIKKVKEELDSLKSSQELKEKEQAESAKRDAEEREQKAVSGFKTDIKQFLSDNATRYELIAFEGQENLVYEVIDAHYNRTIDPQSGVGKVMTKAEAADKVELWLEQKYEKSRSLKKVIALHGLRPEAPKVNAAKQETNRQPPRTLTNQLSASPEKPRTSPITDEERVQKAIAYARTLGLR